MKDGSTEPLSHVAWRVGQEIALTNKEYALLEFLLRNKNRVLTRTATLLNYLFPPGPTKAIQSQVYKKDMPRTRLCGLGEG